MTEVEQRAVDESLRMMAIIATVSSIQQSHQVRHHFLAPDDVLPPLKLSDGRFDLRDPVASYPYIRSLVEGLAADRYEVVALGWDDGLEAIETSHLTDEWAHNSAQEMCRLAEASGTTYGGWDWMSYPSNWKGLSQSK
jgi:hypothetical protein